MARVLIVSIVKRGWGHKILESSMNAGATGGTILFGRGAGAHEKDKILGIPIEPEKEILLTVTDAAKSDSILKAITETCELDKPGIGIAFIVPIEKLVGVSHMSKEEKC